MPFARLIPTIRLALAACILAALSIVAAGQEAPAAPAPQTSSTKPLPVLNFSQPVSHFPNPVGPYIPRRLPPPNLANTPRIDQLMRDGKLYLSLDDAIALALENNLDIAIARYNLNIADTDVMRAKAGAQILGVNVGIVQNTPGGGVGGIGTQVGSGTGGTTLGAGGAGAGAGGIVGSTAGGLFGPLITSFDPIITGTLQEDHSAVQQISLFGGVPIVTQNTGTVNLAYQQGFQWGTNISVALNNTRAISNSPFNIVAPSLASNFQFKLTQHLLQGLGFPANARFIRIAKNNRELSDVAFRLQIITTVDQIENMYWDLVYAYENQRVRQESLAFSQKTFSDTQKQVQIGSLAPIEAVRTQSAVAADQQALTVAKTNLQLQQLIMKNAISRTLHEAALAGADVIPTSTMEIPQSEQTQPTEDLVNDAIRHRPELVEARIQLNSQEESNRALRNGLLPSLDAFAYYGGSGIGGDLSPSVPTCTNANQVFCFNPAIAPPPFRSSTRVSIGSTINQMFNSTAPDKGVGLQLNIPLRNRAAQAVQVRGELEYRQQQMALQQTENRVSIEVRQAQFSVEQNRASVDSAKAAVDYAKQSLDAEQKKFQFGTSTTTAVLQTRSALATAESTLMSAMAAYEKARVELDRATGTLLDHNNISIDDAAKGQVTRMPNVPNVAPRKDLDSLTQPTQSIQPVQPQQ
jgi:outer membrane protein